MTNDEAIYVLKNTAWLGSAELVGDVTEAVKMAVEALKKYNNSTDAIRISPPVLPTYINTHPMQKNVGSTQDCVEKQAVIDALRDWYDGMIISSFRGIEKVIKALPSAQPEIIRCKDCKHSEHWYRDKSRCFLWHEEGIDVFEDGFCNYAERRTDGEIIPE